MINDYDFLYKDSWEVDEAIEIVDSVGLSKNQETLRSHSNISSLLWVLKIANSVNLLDPPNGQANFDCIAQYPPEKLMNLADVVELAGSAGLFAYDQAQDNFNALVLHENLMDVFHCMNAISNAELLTNNATAQANFDTIIKHKMLPSLGNVLQTAATAGLLKGTQGEDYADKAVGQANFGIIAHHKNLHSLGIVLQVAQTAGFFTDGSQRQTNFYFLTGLKPENLNKLKAILCIPGIACLFEGDKRLDNFLTIIHDKNPCRLYQALLVASGENLFGSPVSLQANFDTIVRHKNLSYLILAMSPINNAGLLQTASGQTNFKAIADHPNLPALVDALIAAEAGSLLKGDSAQANFVKLMAAGKNPEIHAVKSPQALPIAGKVHNILSVAQSANAFFTRPAAAASVNGDDVCISGGYRCRTPIFE